MRIALVAAFPFPVPQGSQVYLAEQACALREAGAHLTLFCYGTGGGGEVPELELVRTPAALSPRRLRAGPSPRKPVADLALLGALVRRQRARPFDVVLAHNAEAGLVAASARRLTGLPFVYVAHTLWGEELSSYGPRSLESALGRAGRRLDDWLARSADAVLALSPWAARRLGEAARGPVEMIPPGLAPLPHCAPETVAEACRRHGLVPEGFALYSGNLDGYQDLDLLARVARLLPDLPVVVVTHDSRGPALRGIRVLPVTELQEARHLLHGARVAVLPRRRGGGFPIKLLSYMDAGRAIVAFEKVAGCLTHGRSAWLLPRDAGHEQFSKAIAEISGSETLRRRLGQGAREHLESHHAWPGLADRTLTLARRAAGKDGERPGRSLSS